LQTGEGGKGEVRSEAENVQERSTGAFTKALSSKVRVLFKPENKRKRKDPSSRGESRIVAGIH